MQCAGKGEGLGRYRGGRVMGCKSDGVMRSTNREKCAVTLISVPKSREMLSLPLRWGPGGEAGLQGRSHIPLGHQGDLC